MMRLYERDKLVDLEDSGLESISGYLNQLTATLRIGIDLRLYRKEHEIAEQALIRWIERGGRLSQLLEAKLYGGMFGEG